MEVAIEKGIKRRKPHEHKNAKSTYKEYQTLDRGCESTKDYEDRAKLL